MAAAGSLDCYELLLKWQEPELTSALLTLSFFNGNFDTAQAGALLEEGSVQGVVEVSVLKTMEVWLVHSPETSKWQRH